MPQFERELTLLACMLNMSFLRILKIKIAIGIHIYEGPLSGYAFWYTYNHNVVSISRGLIAWFHSEASNAAHTIIASLHLTFQ